MQQCNICLDNVIIPVELTAFSCSKKNEINCYSFKRICEKCAINFFELNKPNNSRKNIKKCLFCDATINPQEIFDKPYKKDFLLMSFDENKHNCLYCDFSGNHLDLNNHLENNCPNIIISCLCGTNNKRNIIKSDEHKMACCFFKKCLVCSLFIYSIDYESHLLQNHSMNQCNICQKPTLLTISNHLLNECSFRIIKCKHCSKNIVANSYLDHIIEHTKDSQTRINLLKDILDKEYKIYQRYKKEIEDLYELTYGTFLDL